MAKPRRTSAKSTTDQLESRLLETVRRYELVFRATNDVLYELDLVNGTVTWNEALFTTYGFEKKSEIGRLEWWTERIHPNDALRLEQELSRWFESTADSWQTEYRFKIADGSYIHVRDRGAVLRDDQGFPLRIIGSFLDITKDKQLDQAKDEFISLVSHQLRTPLTAVRIYSDMLANGMFGKLEGSQQEYAEYIADASVRLIRQVEDIVHVARVELGQTYSRPTLSNVNNLVADVMNDFVEEAKKKQITIEFLPDSSVRLIPIDPNIFKQILAHYLKNALRYTDQSGTIAIDFRESKGVYRLEVIDHGPGVPRVAKSHIFDRFYRAPDNKNIEHEGNGLGLYLVRLLANITGCKVGFASRKGQTVFYLVIPQSGMN